MREEAAKFTQDVSGTVVNGRVLRSRATESIEKRKPKDEYYERFGRAEEARLLEKFTKKDIIDYLKSLEKEHRDAYEARGVKWPALNMRMSLADIREEYQNVKDFADLPDSDEEDSEEESDDEEDDDEESDAEEDDEDDEADDEDADDEEDDEEDDEDDESDDEESEDEESEDEESEDDK
jgi:hypothetical protein